MNYVCNIVCEEQLWFIKELDGSQKSSNICCINNTFSGLKEAEKVAGECFVLIIRSTDDLKKLSKNAGHQNLNLFREIVAFFMKGKKKISFHLQRKYTRDNGKKWKGYHVK